MSENPAPKKVAIYARVSTKDQNLEMQVIELEAHAKKEGYEVYAKYLDYTTGAIGSKKRRAPKYDALWEDAKQKKFDVVLVWKFDRFARSTIALVSAMEEFKKLNIDFISYTQDIDTTNHMGQFFFQVMAAVAELERAVIKERVTSGVKAYIASGKTWGQPKKRTEYQETSICLYHANGNGITAIAEKFNIPGSSVQAVLKRNNTDILCKNANCTYCLVASKRSGKSRIVYNS